MQQESLIETRWREELQVVADELDVETLGVTETQQGAKRGEKLLYRRVYEHIRPNTCMCVHRFLMEFKAV